MNEENNGAADKVAQVEQLSQRRKVHEKKLVDLIQERAKAGLPVCCDPLNFAEACENLVTHDPFNIFGMVVGVASLAPDGTGVAISFQRIGEETLTRELVNIMGIHQELGELSPENAQGRCECPACKLKRRAQGDVPDLEVHVVSSGGVQ